MLINAPRVNDKKQYDKAISEGANKIDNIFLNLILCLIG